MLKAAYLREVDRGTHWGSSAEGRAPSNAVDPLSSCGACVLSSRADTESTARVESILAHYRMPVALEKSRWQRHCPATPFILCTERWWRQ